MDVIRSRAIPALIALAITTAVVPAHAACDALEGTYRYLATVSPGALSLLAEVAADKATKTVSLPLTGDH